ncbi:AAA family ATPase [Nocardia camponoti]|uniref:AAA family ATPase n=1 Tax=Nocardia camponoti TaxID=1616106 RepID=UPI0016677FCE|nr:AAA family ATPase [Nocardia camponoti]
MLTSLAIANYRSLRDVVVPLDRLTVITGANGSGKSNLYRALRLLADTSRNGTVGALAREGGLPATLWTGPPGGSASVRAGRADSRSNENNGALRLGFAGDDFSYAIKLGFAGGATMFALDPVIKTEHVWAGKPRPGSLLAERSNALMIVTDDHINYDGHPVSNYDSMLSEFSDPGAAPEMAQLRDRMRGWRFYDHFRTDASAPARTSAIGTFTPALPSDGADLPAAIQTVFENGDREGFNEAIDDAFPGCSAAVKDVDGQFSLQWHQQHLLRPLTVNELSDGTLRYLLLVTAMFTPRPPELLVFNEPETSLHPDLFAPLATLLVEASKRTQVVVVSHAAEVIEVIDNTTDYASIELVKRDGETFIRDQRPLTRPAWMWPS